MALKLKKISFFDYKQNIIAKTLKALSLVTFSKLEKNKVVVFEKPLSGVLKKTILYDIPHTVLPASYETFYFSPKIFMFFIKNLLWVYLPYRKYRSFYLCYLLSCIEFIKPKIVISYISYNYIFHAIGEIYTDADFYVIQNGNVDTDSVRDLLPAPPKMGSIWNMQNFLCFGKYYIDLYCKHGHSARKFHPVGSLKGSFYKSEVCPGPIAKDFQLCLISQWRELDGTQDAREMLDAFSVLCDFTSRYIKKHKVSLCVATCSQNQKEKVFFGGFFNSDVTIIENDQCQFSSYSAVDRSNVALEFSSTLGYEVFGWGQKVLFCNFSGKDISSFPFDGLWFLKVRDYTEFENRVSFLLKLSDAEYRRLSEETARKIMNYDFANPVHTYMRGIIKNRIS